MAVRNYRRALLIACSVGIVTVFGACLIAKHHFDRLTCELRNESTATLTQLRIDVCGIVVTRPTLAPGEQWRADVLPPHDCSVRLSFETPAGPIGDVELAGYVQKRTCGKIDAVIGPQPDVVSASEELHYLWVSRAESWLRGADTSRRTEATIRAPVYARFAGRVRRVSSVDRGPGFPDLQWSIDVDVEEIFTDHRKALRVGQSVTILVHSVAKSFHCSTDEIADRRFDITFREPFANPYAGPIEAGTVALTSDQANTSEAQ